MIDEPALREQRRRHYHRGRRHFPILPPKKHASRTWAFEVGLRLVLFCLFFITENMTPFQRVIQSEEMWLYRYPVPEKSYFEEIGGSYLQRLLSPFSMIFYCILVIIWRLLFAYNLLEAREAAYVFFLALPFTGTTVNILKNVAGRPRPDFLFRCYGPYYYLWYTDVSRPCYNDDFYTQDGRKSFPSGHSALAACCFGFLAIFLSGQMGSFHERSKYKITSVIVTLPILVLPFLVAISRTCDYKHHWQDVSVGLLIGFSIVYMSYRIYYPSLMDTNSHLPFVCIEYPLQHIVVRPRPLPEDSSDDEDELNLSDDALDSNDNSVPLPICQDSDVS